MLRKLLFLLCFTGLMVPMALAQTGSITGTVTDAETGETVPSANVRLQEIERGNATDIDGKYTISNIPVGTYTLRVTFVGYSTYTEQVQIQSGENIVDVELQTGAVGLDELVVTGFGQELKRELTGSIASVSAEDFEDVPAQNAAGILQGRAPGVRVTSTSGNAGAGFSVQVRGNGSINAGTQPLYIIDGVQLSFSNQSEEVDESPLNGIAPNDIESIEVLKDAAATAIYGTQGANGVVLITTKRGNRGNTQISASVERGVRTQIDNIDYFNTAQYIEYNLRAIEYDFGIDRATATEVFNGNLPQGGVTNLTNFGYAAGTSFDNVADTDWRDLVSRDGSSEKYNLSISGGDEKTRFRISGAFENTEDFIEDSDFKRYNFRTNFDHQVSSKFSTRLNLALTNSLFGGVCQDGFFINCPISASTFEPPVTTPYIDANGNPAQSLEEGGDFSPFTRFGLTNNPALIISEVDRNTSSVQVLGDIAGTYNFYPWLSLRGQFGLDYRTVRDKRFDSPTAAPAVSGSINESEGSTININTNATLNFRKTFSDVHNVQGLVGTEYRRDFTRELETTGQGYPNGLFRVLDAAATPTTTSGFEDEFRIAGYFANAKYNYDQRYFLSATGRYDGSSRFGEEDRWGFFPAVSGRWAIAEEDFFESDTFEDLSLRASYGSSGNSNIGLYAARGLYGTSGSYSGTTGLSPTQLANPQLTWERSVGLNLGLDFGLWRGRLTGSLDVYQRDNEALLLGSPLPGDSSFGSITQNIGSVRNEGVEISLNSINVSTADFQWSTNFNVSLQRNEVLELTEGTDALNPGGLQPIQVGESIRQLNLARYAGVNPADGRPLWLDADGNLTYNPVVADRVLGENGDQDIVGGIGTTLNYKGLSLDVFFNYGFGQHAQPQQEFFFGTAQIISSNTNGVVDALTDSWRQPGDITRFPAPNLGGSNYTDTGFFSQDSDNSFFETDYVRLKRVRLGYSLPTSLTDQLSLRSVQLYVTAENLLTFTTYPGFDPEVAGSATAASFPPSRQVNGGIRVQF